MAKVRVVLNKQAVQAILKAEKTRSDMERRARNIAKAAGDGHGVESEVGRNRARAVVFTRTVEAARREAVSKSLTRSIDRGRE